MLTLFNLCPSPVLSEWSDGTVRADSKLSNQQPAALAHQYVCESILQGWCRQAQWMEDALVDLRGCLGPQLQHVSLVARGRALGGFHTCLNAHTSVNALSYIKSLKSTYFYRSGFVGESLPWEPVCVKRPKCGSDWRPHCSHSRGRGEGDCKEVFLIHGITKQELKHMTDMIHIFIILLWIYTFLYFSGPTIGVPRHLSDTMGWTEGGRRRD